MLVFEKGEKFFIAIWLVIALVFAITIGLYLGLVIQNEKTKNICLKHGIIKYHPDTGKLKIQPEYTNSNYEYLKKLPGTDLEWWE